MRRPDLSRLRRHKMPSFREQSETAEDWQRFPGLETLPAAARAQQKVALTFDDGPDTDATPAILDALGEAGIKATFFVVGEQLMRHHAIARRAAEEGHELALHGFSHRRHSELIPPDARDEIPRGIGAFQAALGGLTPKLFRPPYGRFSEHSYKGCQGMRLEPIYWSAWGLDWYDIGPEEIADLVIRDLEAGTIVLLHDSPRWAHRPDAMSTADAIPLIAAAALDRGLSWTTVGQAVHGASAP